MPAPYLTVASHLPRQGATSRGKTAGASAPAATGVPGNDDGTTAGFPKAGTRDRHSAGYHRHVSCARTREIELRPRGPVHAGLTREEVSPQGHLAARVRHQKVLAVDDLLDRHAGKLPPVALGDRGQVLWRRL
jgi:hypothetical protein